MKLTIDKNFTVASRMKDAKQAAKDIKAIYTDGDFLRMYNEAQGDTFANHIDGDILENNGELFIGAWLDDDVHIFVHMTVYAVHRFYRLSFFLGGVVGALELVSPNCASVEIYERA